MEKEEADNLINRSQPSKSSKDPIELNELTKERYTNSNPQKNKSTDNSILFVGNTKIPPLLLNKNGCGWVGNTIFTILIVTISTIYAYIYHSKNYEKLSHSFRKEIKVAESHREIYFKKFNAAEEEIQNLESKFEALKERLNLYQTEKIQLSKDLSKLFSQKTTESDEFTNFLLDIKEQCEEFVELFKTEKRIKKKNSLYKTLIKRKLLNNYFTTQVINIQNFLNKKEFKPQRISEQESQERKIKTKKIQKAKLESLKNKSREDFRAFNLTNYSKEKTYIYVIPHSHTDVGWLETIKDYYSERKFSY